ncbi:hypothetical protein [Dickeya oryzae]|uniref:DUF4878 domain-containing protein n=2 Tax=Dickeya oryzae TaxID=1240404 RepID=A0AB39IRQ6_9GAMM|nr:hypothetical protein [Dickeya oryzae]MCA6990036.1 hypothetical protein [Dickeya oryzae]
MSVVMMKRSVWGAQVAILWGVVMGGTTLLAGCGGAEPTEQEIRQAVDESVTQTNQEIKQRVGSLFNDEMLIKINSLKRLSCINIENNTYQCNVELDITPPQGGNKKETVVLVFIRENGKWQIIK